MKNKLILSIISLCLVACSQNISNDVTPLRPLDAGSSTTTSVDLQAQYSEYIWADEPLVYIPTFGVTFNATEQSYVDVYSNELDNINTFTVEFWFDPDLTGPWAYPNEGFIIVSNQTLDSTTGFFFGYQGVVDRWDFVPANGSSGTVLNPFTTNDMVEGSNHVVIQTKTGGFNIFLNGILVSSPNYTGYVGATDRPLRIGAHVVWNGGYYTYNPGDPFSYFIGELDNFAYYDRELTTDEILQHYAVGVELLKR